MWARLDSMGEARCKTCERPITWVENVATGKKMPLDGHDLVFIKTSEQCDQSTGELVNCAHVDLSKKAQASLLDDGTKITSHFATCPDADRHRRR